MRTVFILPVTTCDGLILENLKQIWQWIDEYIDKDKEFKNKIRMNCVICNLKIKSQYDYIKCETDQCNNYAHNICVAHLPTWRCINCIQALDATNVTIARGARRKDTNATLMDAPLVKLTDLTEDESDNHTQQETNNNQQVDNNSILNTIINNPEQVTNNNQQVDNNSILNTIINNPQQVTNDHQLHGNNAVVNNANLKTPNHDYNNQPSAYQSERERGFVSKGNNRYEKNMNSKGNNGKGPNRPPFDPNKNPNYANQYSMDTCVICKRAGSIPPDYMLRCFSCENNFHFHCIQRSNKPYKLDNNILLCGNCYGDRSSKSSTRATSSINLGSDTSQRVNNQDNRRSRNSYQQNRNNVRTPNRGNNRAQARQSFLPPNLNEHESTNSALLLEMKRNQVRQLPIINEGEGVLMWPSFIAAFKETENLFSIIENSNRIKEAIKDSTLLQIGGSSLISITEFQQALENISRRMKDPDRMIQNHANKLLGHKKPEPNKTKQVIELMDAIIDFYTILKSIKSKTYYNNMEFISNVADKLPNFIQNKFYDSCRKSNQAGYQPNFRNLAEVVEEQLEVLQTRLNMESYLPRNNATKQQNNNQKKPVNKLQINENENVYNIQYQKQENNNIMNNRDNNSENTPKRDICAKYCWYHKSTDHYASKCQDLRDMSGKEVFDLAKANNICFYCGLPRHENCNLRDKLCCRICKENHYTLFCWKRKGRENKTLEVETQTNYVNMLRIHENEEDEEIEENDQQAHGQFFIQEIYNEEVKNEYNNNKETVLNINNNEETNTEVNEQPTINIHGCVSVELKNGTNLTVLIDYGSTTSLIKESFADKALLEGPKYPLNFQSIGNKSITDINSRIVKLQIKNCGIAVYARTFKQLNLPEYKFKEAEFKQYEHLKDLKLKDYDHIDAIIGLDNPEIFEQIQIFESKDKNDPTGYRCPLGDYIIWHKRPVSALYEELQNKVQINNENLNNSSSKQKTNETTDPKIGIDISVDVKIIEHTKINPEEHIKEIKQSFKDEVNYKRSIKTCIKENKLKLPKIIKGAVKIKDKKKIKKIKQRSISNKIIKVNTVNTTKNIQINKLIMRNWKRRNRAQIYSITSKNKYRNIKIPICSNTFSNFRFMNLRSDMKVHNIYSIQRTSSSKKHLTKGIFDCSIQRRNG